MTRPASRAWWGHPGAWLWAVAGLVAFLAMYQISDYGLFKLSRVLTTAIALASLNLLTGRTGQVSVGQGALFGLGAYSTAVLLVHYDIPLPLAVIAAMVICFLAGVLLGLPALRISGLHLGLLTIALAVLFPLVLNRLPSLTGGATGLSLPALQPPAALTLSEAQWAYLLDLVALALVLLALAGLTNGRMGRAMDSLRRNRVMAAAMGVRVPSLLIGATAVSSAVAGLGGALSAITLTSVTPDTFSVNFSIALLTGAVVGGLRSWTGVILGAIFVVYLPDLVAAQIDPQTAGQWSQVLYAAVLLLTIYFAPDGIAGIGTTLRDRIRASRRPPAGGITPSPASTTLEPSSTPEGQRLSVADTANGGPT